MKPRKRNENYRIDELGYDLNRGIKIDKRTGRKKTFTANSIRKSPSDNLKGKEKQSEKRTFVKEKRRAVEKLPVQEIDSVGEMD